MLYLILGTSKMTVEINFWKKELEMEKKLSLWFIFQEKLEVPNKRERRP